MQPFAPLILAALALAACVREPEPAPAPVYDPNIDVTPGWNDKEPDTCHASQLQHLVGQPVEALHMEGIPRAYRVIAPGAIVSQEYDSQRLDAYIDGAGTIVKVSCG